MNIWRPALVFGAISLVIGMTLLTWGLTREYRDLQRIYALALGFAGVAGSVVLGVIAVSRRSEGTRGRSI